LASDGLEGRKQRNCPTRTISLQGVQMNIFNAQLDTPHFSFSAYGKTEAQARKALTHGLRQHSYDYKIRSLRNANWWMEFETDIIVTKLRLNACYRDGARISIV
jgi:hypothetical protein